MACTCNEYNIPLNLNEQATVGCQSGSDEPCECVAIGQLDQFGNVYNNIINNICGGTTTQNPNPSGNGSVNYTYCYCPLSFCELAALELGDSFGGGVFGGGAIAGENDTDVGWSRNGNTWSAPYNLPCGASGTMSMECDDATSRFNFSATSSCCDSLTITPPSSNSVQKPPEFTVSSPVSNCNCPPECCHEGDCGWTSGGTTTPNPNATTTINPNATTTQNPNATTTENPNVTTQNPNGTTQNPVTTQDPNSQTTCPPGRFGWSLIGGITTCYTCSADPYCVPDSVTVYASCEQCYSTANALNQGFSPNGQNCDDAANPIGAC